MNTEHRDEILKCAAIVQYVAASVPELEKSDILSETVAHGIYEALNAVSERLTKIAESTA